MIKTSVHTITRTIQHAVDAARAKGVAVTVKITEGSFFPQERNTIEITATPVKPVQQPAAKGG